MYNASNMQKERYSKKRAEILAVLNASHEALSAGDIHNALPHMDLTTIYRNVERFVRANTLREVHLGDETVRYELKDAHHHHAVCTECERVIHFSAPDAQLKKLLGIEDFNVDEIEILVRGRCAHEGRRPQAGSRRAR